jgi:hypothetical protein
MEWVVGRHDRFELWVVEEDWMLDKIEHHKQEDQAKSTKKYLVQKFPQFLKGQNLAMHWTLRERETN